MIQLEDRDGRVTSVLCFLLLLTYHASRDALITALPSIAACTNATTFGHTDISALYEARNSLHPIDLGNSPLSSAIRVLSPGSLGLNDRDDSNERVGFQATLSKQNGGITKQDGSYSPITRVVESKDEKLNYDQIADEILTYQKHLDNLENAIKLDEYREGITQDAEDNEIQRNPRLQQNPHDRLYSSIGWLPEDYQLTRDDLHYEMEPEECSDFPFEFGNLHYEAGWSLAVQGSVLSVLHWLTIPGLFIGYYCTETSKVSEGVVGAVFTLQWGTLVLLTQLFERWGPVALTALRAWQGLAQGACYPCVYALLHSRSINNRSKLVVIFTGVWVGSALGTSLGTYHTWYIPFYCAGGLALAVGVTLLFLAPGPKRVKESCSWRVVLQRDVVVSAMMHGGGVWVLHTLLIVPTMVVAPEERWWVLLVVVTAGGATSQLLEAAADYFVPSKERTARGHLLTATIVGFTLTAGALILVATKGSEVVKESSSMVWVLIGATFGTTFGMGVTSIGYRQVLEAASLCRRSQILVVVNTAGAAGAALASLLLPSMTQAGQHGGYESACLLPLSLVVAGVVCAFMFLLFPTTKEEDLTPPDFPQTEPGVYVIPLANGHAGGAIDGFSRRSGDNKSFASFKSLNSFKSLKSAVTTASYKTAASRPRARTSSFNTVMEMTEDDMQSLPGEDSVDCRSVLPDNEDDLKSLASVATSYRSTQLPQPMGGVAAAPSLGELMCNGDRTSAWLQLYHQVDVSTFPAGGTTPIVYPLPGLLV